MTDADDLFAPIGGSQRDCPVCGDSMFPCDECAARESELPPGEVPTEPLSGSNYASETDKTTAQLDPQGQPYCPDCRVVLGSLIPCPACEAKGVATGEIKSETAENPFETHLIGEPEQEVEVRAGGFVIGGLDELSWRILALTAIFIVLYQGLAWTARSEPNRKMPTTAVVVGENESAAVAHSGKLESSQGLRALQEAIKLFKEGDVLAAQRRAEVARDLYIAEGADQRAQGEAYFMIAICLVARDQHSDGLEARDKAIALDPQNASYQEKREALRKGVSRRADQDRERQVQAAIKELQQAHELLKQGRHEESRQLVSQVIPRLDELQVSTRLRGQAHALLGAIHLADGEFKEARRELEAAYRLEPDPEYKKALDGLP